MVKEGFLFLYYVFAQFLPGSYSPFLGKMSNAIRIYCVKHIFKKCGKISTIDRRVYFGNGCEIEIGDYSGIGSNNVVPKNIKIGKYVMMAPNVIILDGNHEFSDIETPMCFQGKRETAPIVIEDDVWLGQNVIVTPGHRIGKGSIVAAGAVVTKDVVPMSVVGGNPARIIRMRK